MLASHTHPRYCNASSKTARAVPMAILAGNAKAPLLKAKIHMKGKEEI
jgi:hypothetical protein